MDKNYTHIVLVVDRSASMWVMQKDANKAIKDFINSQQEKPGKTTLTLVEFDSEYNLVHNFIDINSAPEYKLEPRGSTSLYDAVGKTMLDVGIVLNQMPESLRPGLVVFMIVSDGCENSSKEFKADQIKNMIETQQYVYSWKFSYLGTNQDAMVAGQSIGIDKSGISFYGNDKIASSYSAMSNKIDRMRSATMANSGVDNSFTEEEIQTMAGSSYNSKVSYSFDV